jgi:8-oxo-dGTP pyrophosphatase MutT (NUDIX family)
MNKRIDYFNDPHAPQANSIVPAATAIVTNNEGKILLQRRTDNALWSIPGGVMEIGESIGETIIREVKEEAGLDVVPMSIVGVYSNPKHVIAYSNGEVRQQFALCFACTITGGELKVSEESFEVAFFSPEEIERLAMHESTRLRIRHFLTCTKPIIN